MKLVDRLAKPLFWIALIVAYAFAVMPQQDVPSISSSDKVEHMLAFFVLGALARLAYRTTAPLRTWLLLAAFGALIEFTQMIPALHRDGELLDWIADVVALSVAILLVTLLTRRRVPT